MKPRRFDFHRFRKEHIQRLRGELEREYVEAFDSNRNSHEDDLARAAYKRSTRFRWNQVRSLEQWDERRMLKELAIKVPNEYLQPDGAPFDMLLSDDGVLWARKQIIDHRFQRAKDWAAILTPTFQLVFSILSAIIAILGLMLAFRKK